MKVTNFALLRMIDLCLKTVWASIRGLSHSFYAIWDARKWILSNYALKPELCPDPDWLKAFSITYTVAAIHVWLNTVKTLRGIYVPMIFCRFVQSHIDCLVLVLEYPIDFPCLLLIYFV